MGMAAPLARRWAAVNDKYLLAQERAADASGGLGALSKVLRFLLQSLVLGVGAWLVILDMASPGVIIAASILTSRALAPIETAIAHWRVFLAARQSWTRLNDLLMALPPEAEPMALPAPKQTLSGRGHRRRHSRPPRGDRQQRQLRAAGRRRPRRHRPERLRQVDPGAGPRRGLADAARRHPARRGDLDHWSPAALGASVGYMPQAIELFDGTVAENIARFSEQADPAKVVAAAQAAGAHEMILRLPDGYDTRIGEGAGVLSAGQRQRIALARALYGDPFVVVLDEPNSNLDSEGEAALTEAIKGVRARGGIVIVVAHRPSALAALDQVLVMRDGTMQASARATRCCARPSCRKRSPAGEGAPPPRPMQRRSRWLSRA